MAKKYIYKNKKPHFKIIDAPIGVGVNYAVPEIQGPPVRTWVVLFSFLLAAFFAWLVFVAQVGNFWLMQSGALILLVLLVLLESQPLIEKKDFNLDKIIIGLAVGAAIYFIFLLGNFLASLFPAFFTEGIESFYTLGQSSSLALKLITLIIIIAPAAEIFWRGFVQRWAMTKFGRFKGLLLATAFYVATYITTLNIALMIGAVILSLCFGALYIFRRSLGPCIVAHILWSVSILVFFPLTNF